MLGARQIYRSGINYPFVLLLLILRAIIPSLTSIVFLSGFNNEMLGAEVHSLLASCEYLFTAYKFARRYFAAIFKTFPCESKIEENVWKNEQTDFSTIEKCSA